MSQRLAYEFYVSRAKAMQDRHGMLGLEVCGSRLHMEQFCVVGAVGVVVGGIFLRVGRIVGRGWGGVVWV